MPPTIRVILIRQQKDPSASDLRGSNTLLAANRFQFRLLFCRQMNLQLLVRLRHPCRLKLEISENKVAP